MSSLQQPVVVMSTKAKANPQVLKVASRGKGKGPIGKGKGTKSLTKGKGNVAKPSTSKATTSASPSTNLRDKAKDYPVVTVTMLQVFSRGVTSYRAENPLMIVITLKLLKRVTRNRKIVKIV